MKIKALRQMVGVYGRLDPGVATEVPDRVAKELIALGRAVEAKDVPPPLRDDGPTIEEFVAAGYSAATYPPQGYAPRSTPEEIAAAIEAQAKAEADAKAAEEAAAQAEAQAKAEADAKAAEEAAAQAEAQAKAAKGAKA
jgi:hypothetical protein